MYTQYKNISVVTAILPTMYAGKVINTLRDAGHDILSWHARGTLQDNRWYRKFIPMISPEKEMLRFIVPDAELEEVMRCIVEDAKLDRNGMGAVFSVPCLETHVGGHFQSSWAAKTAQVDHSIEVKSEEQLSVIQCIVEQSQSELVTKAAIDAGAHGPIVHYTEGRGLRDRLGWLRITKQAEKEVLTIVVDNAIADNVFKAMAVAGKLDHPGRGFMYQTPVQKGLFNLPSHFDANNYDANMPQIISAIDHLMGDHHWRDQSVFEVSGTGKTAGLKFVSKALDNNIQTDKVSLTAVCRREYSEQTMELMLAAGAPGLSVSYCQYKTTDDNLLHAGVNLVNEYCMVKCIVDDSDAHAIMNGVKNQTQELQIEDLCLYLQQVPKVITYLHHPLPERRRLMEERIGI